MTRAEIIAAVLAWLTEGGTDTLGAEVLIVAEIAGLTEDDHGPWCPWWEAEMSRYVWSSARLDAPPWAENFTYRTLVIDGRVETIEDGDPLPPAALARLRHLIPEAWA